MITESTKEGMSYRLRKESNGGRCKRCIMSECRPLVTLDSSGLCNLCHDHRPYNYHGEESFLQLIEAPLKNGRKYDCAVSLSGGRDSTYTLLKMVKDYDLKVLAINYDNPFTHPMAKANIQNAVEALDVDLISFRLKNHIHERTFKSNLQSWLKKPNPAMIPMLCVACKNMMFNIIRIARKNNVSSIVMGGNIFEDTSFKKVLLGLEPDMAMEETFTNALGGVVKGLLRNPSYLNPRFIPTMAIGYLFGDPYALGSRWYGRRINMLDLFHYIPWNEEECLTRIRSEVGWDYPKELGTWRWDCMVGVLKERLYSSTIGLNEKEDLFSKQVRERMITRDEALQKLEENQIDTFTENRAIERLMALASIEDRSVVNQILSQYGGDGDVSFVSSKLG